jgi:hypothetical protein
VRRMPLQLQLQVRESPVETQLRSLCPASIQAVGEVVEAERVGVGVEDERLAEDLGAGEVKGERDWECELQVGD